MSELPPLILTEDEPTFRDAKRQLEDGGWTVGDGWDLPEVGWDLDSRRTVRSGSVRDRKDADAAIMAAARGAGVLILLRAEDPLTDHVYENLSRLGPVDHRTAGKRRGSLVAPEDRRLMELLGEGKSVTEAAADLHISRRSAERRLASIRERLGARTTTEALLAARARREERSP